MSLTSSVLSPEFYSQNTPTIARALIGCILIHQTQEGVCSGLIVETEAYLHNDPASHSFSGPTERNRAMFGPPGHAYIYQIYGLHLCLNVVTNRTGIGEAVLIRALEPLIGIEIMQKHRKTEPILDLCRGPARLVKALAIPREANRHDLSQPPLYISTGTAGTIGHSTRIGINKAQDLQLRFYLENSPFVSAGHRRSGIATATNQMEGT